MPFVSRILLVVFSLLVGVLFSEVVLRVIDFGGYSASNRVLYYSLPAFIVDENRAVRYAPERRMRHMAVYGDVVEYDTFKSTNNLGFLDSIDYVESPSDERDVVFVGDSFTAGSGSARSWVEVLRELQDFPSSSTNVYNLGVAGTGVRHFTRLVDSFSREIKFDELNVVLITSDIYRPYWIPVTNSGKIWFCRESSNVEECSRTTPMIHGVSINENRDVIVDQARTFYQAQSAGFSEGPQFLAGVRVVELLCKAAYRVVESTAGSILCPHMRAYRLKRYAKTKAYWSAIELLVDMKRKYRDVRVRIIHIPEKGEVFAGRYYVDMRKDFASAGLEYVPLLNECKWDEAMFYKNDSHLNDSGYLNLTNCVARILPWM